MEKRNNKLVLVTGGSGFVGHYCLIELLNNGYNVRTTVRSLKKQDEVKESLRHAGVKNIDVLEFIEADLTSDLNWEKAVKGCEFVLHVASPFPAVDPENADELIIPARDGALRVLKAARDAGVKRVVLTSSFAAVGYSTSPKGHVYTEADWTDPESNTNRAYIRSKAVAEKAAWDFIDHEGKGLELSVINPVGVFGPALGRERSTSIGFVEGLLSGAIKEDLPFYFGVVDVRDVAALHLKAMLHPEASGERFIATSDGAVCIYDVAELIRKERPRKAINIASLKGTDPELYTNISNQKAKEILDWHPRAKEEALLATVDSL